MLLIKVDDLKNRSRPNNLIIFGLKEADETGEQSLEVIVSKTILKDKLNIADVAIERIHRTGERNESKCIPVVLKLLGGKDKGKILKKCSNLKATGFSVSEDFSPRVWQIRNKLLDATTQHRDNGDKVGQSFIRQNQDQQQAVSLG